MAEKQAPEQAPPKKRRLAMTLVIVAGVAIVEAGGFYAFAKLFGGAPQASYGQTDGHYAEGDDPTTQPGTAEVVLVSKFKAPNSKSGRLYIYDLDVVVKVPADKKTDVEELVAQRQGEISDTVARLIRGADPRVLAEDELKTLRVQIQHALVPVLEDPDLVRRVLIPRCVPILSS